MTPVPKCFAAKKMFRKAFLAISEDDISGRHTPIALAMRTMLWHLNEHGHVRKKNETYKSAAICKVRS